MKMSQVRPRAHGTTLSVSNSERNSFRRALILSRPPFSKLGPRLKVVALIDPATERAAAVLQSKCESFVKTAYEHTRICKNLDEFFSTMTKKEYPKAVIIGSPPMFRGSTAEGKDIEIQLLKKFPGIALFVEKPVATGRFEELGDAFGVAKAIENSGNVCSVG